jgi:hypothetical protein
MDDTEFFRSKGGVLVPRKRLMSATDCGVDGESCSWNFGLVHVQEVKNERMRSTPGFYDRFPKLQGKWDGTSTVNHHDAVLKALGKHMPAHNQPRGTCGGRAGARSLELLQCVLIASGVRAEFHYVSHAAIYMFARMKYDMANGSPSDENNDGVAGGSVPEILGEVGVIHRDESEDKSMAGQGSDDVACTWGAGKIDPAKLSAIKEMARDNIVTAKVRLRSAQECADLLASGGIICQSDMQGYSMKRDAEGVCRAQGEWAHYQVRSGVRVTPSGRKVFQYDQSWGDDTPQGPPLPGCPGNVFGVEWSVQDRLCRTGEVDGILGFDLWKLENNDFDLEWIF